MQRNAKKCKVVLVRNVLGRVSMGRKEIVMEKKKEPRISVVYDYEHRGSDAEGKTGTVYVRVYYTRTQRKYISTGVHVLPSQWSDEYWVVRRDDAELKNKLIQEQVDVCREKIRESLAVYEAVEHPTLPTTQQMKVDRNEASFLDWMRNQIDIATDLVDKTKAHHYKVLRNLENFGKIKRFEDINVGNLYAWLDEIKKRKVRKVVDGEECLVPISQVSVYGYYKVLSKWLTEAQNRRIISMDATRGWSCEKGESEEREFLTEEEIKKWKEVELTNTHQLRARDRFIVQMCTGFAYVDLFRANFKGRMEIDGQICVTKQRKKSKKQYFTVVLQDALPILDKWGWEIPMISGQKYNEYLQEVAAIAGIEKHITSHVARHTYATWCLTNDIPLEVIRDTLGHVSIKTTEIYAKMINKKVIGAFNNIKKKKKK